MRFMMRGVAAAVAALVVACGAGSAVAQTCNVRLAPASLTPTLPGTVNVLAAYDDGSGLGKAIFAGGSLDGIGGVARLTPDGWIAAGLLSAGVQALEVIPDGTGPGGRDGFYAGSSAGLFRWDGSAWQAIAPAPGGTVYAITWLPNAAGEAVLHVISGTSSPLTTLRRLENGQWTAIATMNGNGRWSERVVTYDEDGPHGLRPQAIYMASNVTFIQGSPPLNTNNAVVRWDGAVFSALPAPQGIGAWFKSIEVYDDGLNGESLYISGHGTGPLGNIARWDATTQSFVAPWRVLPGGDAAYGMAVLPDGQGLNTEGSRLYGFTQSSGLGVASPSRPSAAFDGQAWSTVQAPAGGATNMGYHFPTVSGEIGAGRVPAVVVAHQSGTAFYALVGCPRCIADMDFDGTAGVGDVFAYLDVFFARDAAADLDGNSGVTVQDLFSFLQSYADGCD